MKPPRAAPTFGVPARPQARFVRSQRDIAAAVGIFVIVLLALQVFLLTVGVDALLAADAGLAWTTAGFSVLLFAGAALFYRYLR